MKKKNRVVKVEGWSTGKLRVKVGDVFVVTSVKPERKCADGWITPPSFNIRKLDIIVPVK